MDGRINHDYGLGPHINHQYKECQCECVDCWDIKTGCHCPDCPNHGMQHRIPILHTHDYGEA